MLRDPPGDGSLDGAACFGAPPGTWVALERLLTLVDDMGGENLVMVVADVHWADETNLIAWRRPIQSVEQLSLLLIAIARPLPSTTW